VLIESTYGDRTHPVEDILAELAPALQRVAKRGGVAVVPVFAVGRAQALLHAIHLLKLKGDLPTSLPVLYATERPRWLVSVRVHEGSDRCGGGTPLAGEAFVVTLLGHPDRVLGTFVADRDGLLRLGSYPPDSQFLLQYAGSRSIAASDPTRVLQADQVCLTGDIGLLLNDTATHPPDLTWALLAGLGLIGLATMSALWLPGGGQDRAIEIIVQALRVRDR